MKAQKLPRPANRNRPKMAYQRLSDGALQLNFPSQIFQEMTALELEEKEENL